MARLRREIVSDDEEPSVTPRRPTNSRASLRRDAPRASTEGTTAEPIPDLPGVAKLAPEDVQNIRRITGDYTKIARLVGSAVAIISDAAVAVEELNVSAKDPEVSLNLLDASYDRAVHC